MTTTTESADPTLASPEGPGSAEDGTAAAAPTPAVAPALVPCAVSTPAPVLAPYLGLVTSVLCALGGGWLLLAPYALGIRRGAAKPPRPVAVELETGAAIAAVALLSAILFGAALFARLRPAHDDAIEAVQPAEPESAVSDPNAASDLNTAPDSNTASDSHAAADSSAASTGSDTGAALREMLTPLVAALAADLRSQDRERTEQFRRQEP